MFEEINSADDSLSTVEEKWWLFALLALSSVLVTLRRLNWSLK
jgi:hypothetical protein